MTQENENTADDLVNEEEIDLDQVADASGEEVEAAAIDDLVDDGAAAEPDLTPAEEVEKWKDHAARSAAEFDNYRKRMAREKTEAIQYANRKLLEELLPIIDNFQMGLKACEAEGDSSSMIFQGMSMVYGQVEEFLKGQGAEPIDADGQPFDPNLHEALKQEPSDEVPEGTVIYTARRGYRMKDRLLRAANVVVSSGPEAAAEAE